MCIIGRLKKKTKDSRVDIVGFKCYLLEDAVCRVMLAINCRLGTEAEADGCMLQVVLDLVVVQWQSVGWILEYTHNKQQNKLHATVFVGF